MKLVFLGGGKMAEALIGGLLRTGWAEPSDLGVIEISAERRDALSATYPGLAMVADSGGADVLIAVKPQHVEEVARAASAAGTKRALCIAAGVTITSLETWLGTDARVIRAMPNTPALVGHGAAGIAAGTSATDDDLGWARSILSAVGTVEEVTEASLDAVTGVSGSGPAYVFLFAEALVAAGVDVGLDPEVADRLARQTLLGAASLLAQSGEDPAVLRANVTSPGGTTAEGIAALEAAEVRQAVLGAVRAATARSVELGK